MVPEGWCAAPLSPIVSLNQQPLLATKLLTGDSLIYRDAAANLHSHAAGAGAANGSQ
jgi:hypothetical protein